MIIVLLFDLPSIKVTNPLTPTAIGPPKEEEEILEGKNI